MRNSRAVMRHFFLSEIDASVSWEKELRLAAEAVRMKPEEERLQQAELHCGQSGSIGRGRSDGRAIQMILSTLCR